MSDETASLAAAKVSAVAKAAASTAVDIEQMRPTAIAHRDVVTMGWLRLVGSLNYRSLLQNIVCFIVLFDVIDV